MGRHRKYYNDEEKNIAKKKQWREYYIRNKDVINKKRMDKYYEQKNK